MMHTTRTGIFLLVLAEGLTGCGRSNSLSPSGPSPVSQAASGLAATQQLSGSVLDSGFRPLSGASIEVLDGPNAGTSATADGSGQFSLSGVFDHTTRFRASKEGHVPATQAWNCSVQGCPGNGARPWLLFYLAVLAAPVNIAGDYTLTFVADPACTDLPSEVRTRNYAATIAAQSNPNRNTSADSSLLATVMGAVFLGDLNKFEIGIAGEYLGFWLHGGHDPAVVEQLGAGTYLAFSGNAGTSVGSGVATISTAFNGWIEYCVMSSDMGSVYNCGTSNVTGQPIPGVAVTRIQCESKNHRIILTRR